MAKREQKKCRHGQKLATIEGCGVCVGEILRARKILDAAESAHGMDHEDVIAAIDTAAANKANALIPKQWDGRPVPADETPETEIAVWEIEDLAGDIFYYSTITVRSLNDLLSTIDVHLDGHDEEDLRSGIGLRIKLKTMKRGEFDALPE